MSNDARPRALIRRFSAELLAFSVVAVVIGIGVLWTFWEAVPYRLQHPETGFNFPDIDQISSITIEKYYDQKSETDLGGQVPKEHWQGLLNALQPSELDLHPIPWVVMGIMRIQTKNGQQICIAFGEGVFCAGDKPWSPTRKYFITGKSTELAAALTQVVPSLRPVQRAIESNTPSP